MGLIIKSIVVYLVLLTSLPVLSQSEHYTIFVDAGSSGSRLHIFQYDDDKALPIIKDVFSVSVKPGLSSYVEQPQAAGPALSQLFNGAAKFLQEKYNVSLQTVPVNILATAGMRKLPVSQQQAIYSEVTRYLKEHYSVSALNIQTISGSMEGLYGWLDVNYLLGNFQRQTTTIGSIDMGGASTQITYAIAQDQPANDAIKITINHYPYHVFSKSFLGMGQDEARKETMNSALANACYPKQYTFIDNRTGAFNFNQCAELYGALIQEKDIANALMPINGQSFIAYSGIYFSYAFFELDKTPDQYTLLARVNAVCNNTWDDMQKLYPKIDVKYLSVYCANAVYHGQLLYDAYRLTGSQLTVTNKINQQEIDWTLGAALYSIVNVAQ